MDVGVESAVGDGRGITVELTTISTTSATFHAHGGAPPSAETLDGLEPGRSYEHAGIRFATLARPSGDLRSRIATVNDVHFGETEAGRLEGSELGPIRRAGDGEPPYAEMMNRAAAGEMAASGPFAAVMVKGDLSQDGTPDEFGAFESCYRPAFGERLFAVRGNHDSYRGQSEYAGDQRIDVPGAVIALMDTVMPTKVNGVLSAEQLEWLDALALGATDPVIVMGHHPQWPGAVGGPLDMCLTPSASAALDDVFARRPSVIAYTAGHTHRHRVQVAAAGVPSVEVGCVKDFPGTWAEYEIYDGGALQIVHRMSSPEALAWSEQCRGLYADFGLDYTAYALGRLEDRCFQIPLRA